MGACTKRNATEFGLHAGLGSRVALTALGDSLLLWDVAILINSSAVHAWQWMQCRFLMRIKFTNSPSRLEFLKSVKCALSLQKIALWPPTPYIKNQHLSLTTAHCKAEPRGMHSQVIDISNFLEYLRLPCKEDLQQVQVPGDGMTG
jgi:hypothetical protein